MSQAVVLLWWPPVSFSLNIVGEIMMREAENEMTHPVSLIRCFIVNRGIKRQSLFSLPLSGESYMSHCTVSLYESVTSGVPHSFRRRHGAPSDYFFHSTGDHKRKSVINDFNWRFVTLLQRFRWIISFFHWSLCSLLLWNSFFHTISMKSKRKALYWCFTHSQILV